MPFLDALLARLRPRGVWRVSMSEAVRSIEGKTVAELYAEQPHLRTVVDFLAQNVAQLAPKCYLRNGDADRKRDTSGALPLLLADPNPDMTGYDLMYSTVADWALYGRAIWLVGRDAKSASGWQVRPVPPTWVQDGRTDGFAARSFTFCDAEHGGGRIEVDASQCVVFTAYRPGSPSRALSPVESLRHTLAEQVEAQAFRRSVWDNATRITGFISRPAGVQWSDAAAERFKGDMRENWGRHGARAGGTPVLEDGMRYEPVAFNAREGDWAAGVKLSREDVAAAYHINPAVIWPGEGQTYASAKDNARALYADTLMPLLTMLQKRITKTLAPMVGAPENEYVEFDIRAKLQGSFEEQAAAIQSAVGGPWMTREEARAMLNMPREPQGDLITPLNVLVGGLASPADTAPKLAPVYAPVQAGKARPRRSKSAPRAKTAKARATDEEAEGIADVLRSFYARQRKSVLAAMGAKSGAKGNGGDPAWWDADRWNRELAEDLASALAANSAQAAKRALESLGIDPSRYDEPRTRNYLRAWAESFAKSANAVTLEQLLAALAGDVGEEAAGATPAGVFDKAAEARAESQGLTLAGQVANWSTVEAARQCAPDGSKPTKTWRTHHSKSPRASHARLNGQTVGIDEKFSNGAQYPGDWSALKVSEVANCHCTIEVSVKEADGSGDPIEDYRADNLDVSALSKKELRRMKREKPGEWAGYVRLSQLGYKQKLLKEDRSASANIDLLMEVDGVSHYWDLKTISGGFSALKKRLKEGYTKWERLSAENAAIPPGFDIEKLDHPRMVVDVRNSPLSDEDAIEQILQSMEYLSAHGRFRFSEALLIRHDGSAEHIVREK